jgi:predicted ATPase
MNLESNTQLRLAAEFVRSTNTNLFLTGRAGTGKTTFLRNLKEITYKRFVVVAPTGVAAINARGVTIHSFFQLPFGPQLPEELQKSMSEEQTDAKSSAARYQRFTREKINIIRSLDLLVIDEISMVRADLLDAIDTVLRRYKDRYKPFGGLQLLMIGDLQQLAPIAKDDEWELLGRYYDSVYFFSSKALKQTDYVSIELNQVFRQSDPHFIQLLNKVRDSEPDSETITELNKRYLPEFVAGDPEGYITLTTHNNQAQTINQTKLDKLSGKSKKFTAEVSGEFSDYNYPTELELLLKEGAQVMFVKNDPSPAKRFFNGKIGKLVEIDSEEESLAILCPDDDEPVYVGKLEWQNTRYSLNEQTKEIEESVIGTFKQFPIKLAWAITIHKSQGLTFDKAIIDAQAAFTHGQVYVALSRCRSLEGMVFRSAIQASAIKSNSTVSSYLQKIDENSPDENKLLEAKARYQLQLVKELFDFSVLNRRLDYLLKICNENMQSLDLSFFENYRSVSAKLHSDFMELSRKFHNQIHNLSLQNSDLENNLTLQERVQKASEYFEPRLKTLVEEMDLEIETDNKTVKKSLQDALERLMLEASIKLSCLREARLGFKVSSYLEVRAKASIGESAKKKKPQNEPAVTVQKKDLPFYSMLKQWRDNLAEEEDLEPYEIMPLRTMKEIAMRMPSSHVELSKVHGMGKVRVKRYGEDILKLIKTFSEKNNLNIKTDFSPLPDKKPKVEKIPSNKISYELFREGKSLEEIAAVRGYAVTTIESHLADYIRLGEIKLEEVMPPEKAQLIIEYFTETEDIRFGPAKQILGDEISYGQLKMALVYLQKKGLLLPPE